MKNKIIFPVFILMALSWFLFSAGSGPYQATGFKTGEVTDTSAIIWTRLTRNKQRNPSDWPKVKLIYEKKNSREKKKKKKKLSKKKMAVTGVVYPKGMTVDDIRDAVPGAEGEVNISYRIKGKGKWLETGWKPVDPHRDFTRQFVINALKPGTEYEVLVKSRSLHMGKPGQSLNGRFRTAPSPGKPAKVVFAVSTGQAYGDRDCDRGYEIYDTMLKLDLDFFIHTGDIIYYDKLAKTIDLARYHWQRTYSLPGNVDFHRQVACYFIKDDHDTWQNDCWPSMDNRKMYKFTFNQGRAVFLEQVPMGKLTYRTRRWGRDLQVWMVEGRDYRSANTDPDGPEKTIWGKEQKEWFKRTVEASDAAFRVLISPTPIVGPDRESKKDNHSNSNFAHEGNEIREFISRQKNMVVVCGDRHWQYVSVDPKTGVREYSCGPASDKHAGGFSMDKHTDMHKYLNIVGGIMTCTVERVGNVPTMTFTHYSPRGKVLNRDILK